MKKPNRQRARSSLQLQLPATSANLGPAFDVAALAFGLFLKIRARAAEAFSITATGRDPEICARVDDHLILTTYHDVLEKEGKPIHPLALHVDNQIPIGKGCGSSAAARLAGIALAVHFGKLRWNDSRIVAEAAQREHHPDNASACWMGGLTVARMDFDQEGAPPWSFRSLERQGGFQVARITPKGKWPLLLAIPDQPLSTEEARKVLPAQYSRADVVTNIQNSMLLLAAFSQGRPDLLVSALSDRIHQPYRAPLCPLLPALQPLAGTGGILGAVLSGAGPSVLLFLDPKSNVGQTKARVAKHLRRQNLPAELISTAITDQGGCLVKLY
jgi:homoserine kinase